MCGIWAWIKASPNQQLPSHEELWEKGVKRLSARGPEGYRFCDLSGATFAFTRLAINGLNEAGMQPFVKNNLTWMCNGEIYNAKDLMINMPSGSDCEVLGELWERCEKDAVSFCRALDGVFAFVLYDAEGDKYVVGRDPYGVRPFYYLINDDDSMIFASERKAIEPFATELSKIEEFPPGEVWVFNTESYLAITQKKYHTVPWLKTSEAEGWQDTLCRSLEKAVMKRVELSERPIAALLSGGLDSSLIAALVQKELKAEGKPPLKTFSIGMPGSTDLKYARMVAEHICSDHTEIQTTAEEMFSYIPDVIRDIESYDITTVRASVGNWLVSKRIRETTDCKVVFNGDGSDEVFGGYLYFYRAPSEEAFERESERLLEEISKYDVLRSDRSISSHGLEPRTPFLDKQFVAVARSLPTSARRPTHKNIEKWCLRRAFAETDLLPNEVLMRKKEAFSDGVSSTEKSWYQEVQDRIELKGLVPEGWEELAKKFCGPVPRTKEAFYYRTLYESMYKHTGTYWPFWMPKWSGETTDPSARTLSLYVTT